MDLMNLVICDSRKNIIDVVNINEKGFKKSLENKVLWYVHEDTGRLVPYGELYNGTKISSIKKCRNWVEAVIEGYSDSEEPKEKVHSSEISLPDILENLEKTIKERAEKLPEGSYTTHLFKSGLSKIRKKTGEEAVELILAKDKDEIVYEAADLIYHIMVLFEAEGLKFGNVLKELEKRM